MPDSATPGTAAHQASLLYTISLNLLKLMNIESIKSSKHHEFSSVQFSSVAQSCPTLCDPMNCSMPGPPVHHQLPDFTQTHVHRVGDVIQLSYPLSTPSPPAPNPSQHQGLFKWVSSSHKVAKVLEFQLQNQSFQWTYIDTYLITNMLSSCGSLFFVIKFKIDCIINIFLEYS